MPTENGVQVPANGASNSNGMGSGAFGGDVGATTDDLDQRLNSRMEKEWDRFRSVTDKRFATVDQMRQEMQQLRQMNQQMATQLQTINGYLTSAQEAELDPDEKAQRQQQRVQQSWLNERQQLAFNARQQNAAFRVMSKIAPWGFIWNDSRINWNRELYDTDPDAWAATVIADTADQMVQAERESRKLQQTQAQTVQTQRSQETQQRQQTDAQNTQRQAQAAAVDTSVPGGPQVDWYERVEAMTPTERKEYIRRTQNLIKHHKIERPEQALQR